jgi:hypothetical protein
MNSLCLTNRSVCPPDGFRYVFPETGYIAHGWNHNDWVNDAIRHLQVNNLAHRADLVPLMEEQLCKTLPPGWCNYDDPNRARVSVSLGWQDVLGGLKTFASWIAQGCQYVTKEEADRRALICSRCYLNVNVQGCTGCQQAVVEVTGNRKSKYDDLLRSCAVCKCFLRAKVHFPISTLDRESLGAQELYPEFCWLNKKSENYRG